MTQYDYTIVYFLYMISLLCLIIEHKTNITDDDNINWYLTSSAVVKIFLFFTFYSLGKSSS